MCDAEVGSDKRTKETKEREEMVAALGTEETEGTEEMVAALGTKETKGTEEMVADMLLIAFFAFVSFVS